MPRITTIYAEITARTTGLKKKLSEATRDMTAFSEKAGRIGTSMSIGLTLPLLAFGRASLNAASDLQETRSKFDAVFKDLSGSVRSWADTHATEIGRSSSDWEKYLGKLQDTLVPLGFARDEAAEMSKKVVLLAEDLASFNNLRTEDVINSLGSAIVGNTENLLQFGVVAQQAQIKQEALRSGMIKSTTDAITPQQKALAVLNLTFAGTKDAQGDAAKTAGSYANKSKALDSSLKKLRETLGERILPAMTKVSEGTKTFVDSVNGLDQKSADKLILLLGAMAAAGPALKIFSKLGVGGLAAAGFGAAFTAAELNKSKEGAVGVFSTWFADGLFAAIAKVRNSGVSPFSDKELNLLSGINTGLLLSSRGMAGSGGAAAGAGRTGITGAGRTGITGRILRMFDPDSRIGGRGPDTSTGFSNIGITSMADMLPMIIPPEFTEGMERASKSMDRVGVNTTEASVRMARFGMVLREEVSLVLNDFTSGLGSAVSNLVIFGDTLLDTWKNLRDQTASSAVSGLFSLGANYALSSLPVIGPLLSKQVSGNARPDTGANVTARISLGDIAVSQQRAARNNGLHLIGLS